MIEILVLSLIQGITEFLPVSSSSHLIIISNIFDFENNKLEIDVCLHIGSFFAVLVYFKEDIFNFLKTKELLIKILISSIPVMIAGYIMVKFDLINQIRNIKVIGWTTLIFGILLFFSDKNNTFNKIENNFTWKNAILIGLFQILSLVPGVSRSGITITSARFLKFNRFDAAKISFLLSIPTLAAVSVFGLNSMFNSGNLTFSISMLVSIIFSFLFSYITIKYFLKFISKSNLNIFVFYRIVLGSIILLIAYL